MNHALAGSTGSSNPRTNFTRRPPPSRAGAQLRRFAKLRCWRLLSGWALLTACAGPALDEGSGPDARQEQAESATQIDSAYVVGLEMKGYIDPVYGSNDQNRCAVDVMRAFSQLPWLPRGIRYWSKGGRQLPPVDATLHTFGAWNNHIQGVGRLAGFDDNRWLVVSRAHDLDRAGVFLAHMGDLDGADGTRLLLPGKGYTDPPPAQRTTEYYFPIQGAHHPGGLSAFGSYVAVAVESPNSAWITIYDFRNGVNTNPVVSQFTLGQSGEVPRPPNSISGVALTRLSNHKYLMFVLGKDTHENGWFYLSDTTNITPDTGWTFVDYVDKRDSSQSFGRFQNAQFITECDTGDVFLLMSGNDRMKMGGSTQGLVDPGVNETVLFRLSTSTETIPETPRLVHSAVHLEWELGGQFSEGDSFECSMRAAAAPFIDKNGNVLLYCHTHKANTNWVGDPDSKLKWGEFSYDDCDDGQCCGGGQTSCGASCCGASESCVETGPAAGSCCAAQDSCGDACCGATDSCVDGACCSQAQTCGDRCCAAGTLCKDARRGLCCGTFEQACGNTCCGLDQVCQDGACRAPPPPPPRDPGSCPSQPGLSCSTLADCPLGFDYCNGCCQQVR
jgi:hypothetical protein